ncbi:MAG: TIM barrel protein [Anaerolineae bacterium]
MIRIANAPCSWGVLEFGLEGKTAGYAQVLDEIHETGYAGTELGDWGFMPTDPAQLRTEVTRRELALLAAFVPVDLSNADKHAEGEGVAVRTARLLAAVNPNALLVLADDNGKNPARTQNAGRVTDAMGLNDAEWQTFTAGVDRVARAVYHAAGLRTVFHHHCAGFVETPYEIDRLLAMTDPKIVGLCFDTGHYRLGGGDPLAGLQKHYDRIWHVHFKDHSPTVDGQSHVQEWDYFQTVRHGIFCELGKGDVNFQGVAACLRERGYEGWIVVEQDVLPGMGSPQESAQRNRDYLRSIGL